MSDQLLIEASRGPLLVGLRDIATKWTRFASSMRRRWEHHRVCRYLSTLDSHLLDDIGLTREQVARDAAKWPWE